MLVPVLALAGLLGLLAGLVVYLLMQKQQPQQDAAQEQDDAAAPQRGGARRVGMDRLQRRRRQQHMDRAATEEAAARRAGFDDDDDDEEDEDEVPLDRREARRAARAEEREAERAARQAKVDKISAYEEKRKQKEEEREKKRQAQEEEMRRAAEEKQKAEDEEAAKWMNLISVEDTGTIEEQAAGEDQGLLGRFIDYIVKRKMVPIEEAATEFGLRSSEVVDRIQGLEAMGRISGVMDERGKFIFISRDEMEAVAAHIRTKGRVSIAALAAASNNLIDLEAKTGVEAVAAGAAGSTGPMIDFDSMVEVKG